jgi:hypothetical protein
LPAERIPSSPYARFPVEVMSRGTPHCKEAAMAAMSGRPQIRWRMNVGGSEAEGGRTRFRRLRPHENRERMEISKNRANRFGVRLDAIAPIRAGMRCICPKFRQSAAIMGKLRGLN